MRAFGPLTPAPEKLGGEAWEKPRGDIGLKLISEDCQNARWRYMLTDDSRRSYVGYLPSPFDPSSAELFFERIRFGADWKQPESHIGLVPRKTCWMVGGGCQCTYRYGGIQVEPTEFPDWMVELMDFVMPYWGLHDRSEWPNSCNLNLYEDGGMSVGWHADDEKLFRTGDAELADIRILSCSFGVTRKFQLKPNWPNADEEKVLKTVFIRNGDLLTMEGMVQKHFQHRVPKEMGVTGARINLTWRWVLQHMPCCPQSRFRR